MTTYCFVCPDCLDTYEFALYDTSYCACGAELRRDWAAENATFTRVPGGNR